MSTVIEPPLVQIEKSLEELETVTIRFAGDSGDGMQLTGTQFTNTSAVMGNDISTLPDFPAEIRAPAGSLPGVSGFQLNFSSEEIKTPGDQPNVLVAMNPAALKVNLPDLEDGGTLILNTDGFTPENLKYANYASNPLEDSSLAGYRVHKLPISTLNMNALKGNVELSRKEIDRSKNFFALGVLYWLYDRPLDNTLEWIRAKFGKSPELAKANEMQPILDAIEHHRDNDVRLCAVRVLGLSGQPQVAQELRQLAGRDDIPDVVRTSILEVIYKADQAQLAENSAK